MPRHAKHALYLPHADPSAAEITVEGDEARHALRVKRVREGHDVAVLDGAGTIIHARAAEARRHLRLEVIDSQSFEPIRPPLDIRSATPKGPRLGEMIDQLSQVGVTAWRPLATAFGAESVSPSKRNRLHRIAVEALKQSHRPWLLELDDEETTLEEAISPEQGVSIVIADASGEPYAPEPDAAAIRLLVGPEGGWREDELQRAIDAGARPCRFGPHTMRIETAAVAAAAIIRHAHANQAAARE